MRSGDTRERGNTVLYICEICGDSFAPREKEYLDTKAYGMEFEDGENKW